MITPLLPDLKIEQWPLDRLTEYARNPRKNDPQIDRMVGALKEFGFSVPILVKADGEVIDGHLRLKAARKLQMQQAPVIVVDHWSDAQIKAFRILSRQSALWSEWDDDLLLLELEDLKDDGFNLALTGFDDAELAKILKETDDDDAGDDEDDENTLPEPRQSITRMGDLWTMGDQRLLCGDSTDQNSYVKVMGDEQAGCCFTSPPYNQKRDYSTGGIVDWMTLMTGVFGALSPHMASDGQILVNLGLDYKNSEWNPYWNPWLDAMRTMGWRRFGLYVWDQGPGLAGGWNGRLAPSFELVFHFNQQARDVNKTIPCIHAGELSKRNMRNKDGTLQHNKAKPVQNFKIPDNVLRVMRQSGSIGECGSHPAVFPIKLAETVLAAFSDPGMVCLEPFSGSGTSLIAAQNLGRQMRGIELSPGYVDIALLRFAECTGLDPVRHDGALLSDLMLSE